MKDDAMRALPWNRTRLWTRKGRMAASALLLVLAAMAPALAPAGDVAIVRAEDGFRVQGWSAPAEEPAGGWASIFQVFVDTAGSGAPPSTPMLGQYLVDEGTLRFKPRFPVAPTVAVRAVFLPAEGLRVETVFPASKEQRKPSTVVEAVYPSGGTIPANLLKIYLHFSASMRRGEAWQHIRLLDEKGEALDLPFLEIDQELWDPEHRRLTVLFDPGRIKRGVLPREEAGGALLPGARYTLVIDPAWRDANGMPLAAGYRKEYTVTEEDRTPIDPATWVLTAPRAGTRDALAVDFHEPMEHALAERLIRVRIGEAAVSGKISLSHAESRWTFVPDAAWESGDYVLAVDTILEDLAGNKVGRAFDVDVFERVTRHVTSETVRLPFRVSAQ